MKRIILPLLFLLILGCFDYTSVVKMETDGSGELILELGIPVIGETPITIEDVVEELDNYPGWQTVLLEVDTIDTTTRIRLQGRFDTPEVFEISSQTLESMGFGSDSFYFSRVSSSQGDKFHWRKSYTSGGILELMECEEYSPSSYIWQEKMVVPGTVIRHNADFQMGDTLIWKRQTLDVINDGLIVEVVWKINR